MHSPAIMYMNDVSGLGDRNVSYKHIHQTSAVNSQPRQPGGPRKAQHLPMATEQEGSGLNASPFTVPRTAHCGPTGRHPV